MNTVARRPGATALGRFRAAQDKGNRYIRAFREIQRGDKQSHWMWFVFPQLAGLAKSETALYFGIRDRAEALAYLNDPVLRRRLGECTTAVLKHDTLMFASPDDRKLRSSMTLFAQVAQDPGLANAVLDKFYGGKPDQLTLDLLAGKPIKLPASRPVTTDREREDGIRRAREALAAAERRRVAQGAWTRDRVSTFVGSFGLSTVATRQMVDAWMADRQAAMKQAWEACAESFERG